MTSSDERSDVDFSSVYARLPQNRPPTELDVLGSLEADNKERLRLLMRKRPAFERTVYGREIVLEIADDLDDYGQFKVRLVVGGRERYVCNFTDKSEDLREENMMPNETQQAMKFASETAAQPLIIDLRSIADNVTISNAEAETLREAADWMEGASLLIVYLTMKLNERDGA